MTALTAWLVPYVPSSQTLRIVRDATGTLLNKLEVNVHFFQLYALMTILTFNVNWPNLWVKIKSVFDWPGKLFSIDIAGAFAAVDIKLSPQVYSYVRFAVIMAFPSLIFLLYLKASSLRYQNW